MKKADIVKCLQEATQKNVTEKGVEWKLLYEDGADAILKLYDRKNVVKSVCAKKGCKRQAVCGDYCGFHCNCIA